MVNIRFSPFNSVFNNGPAGTIVIGRPGKGKTFFLNSVVANALIMEQRVFAIDPKNDIATIQDYFNDMEIIDINKIQPGALNPFNVLKEIDPMIISSIISIICGGFTEQQNNYITPIMSDFVTGFKRGDTNVSMAEIAEYLYGHENEALQAIGAKLIACKETKYGPLLFSENIIGYDDYGNEVYAEKYKFTNKSKVISLHGMNLPKASAKDITDDQRFNSAIVYIICRMIRELMISDNYPTLFVLDESHIAFGTKEFSNVVNDLLILGRSLNIVTLLASQSMGHYPEDIGQFTANSFMFSSSPKDSKEFLRIFANSDGETNIDVESIVATVDNFKTGDCFYIDDKKRSGVFHVTSPLTNMTSNPLRYQK